MYTLNKNIVYTWKLLSIEWERWERVTFLTGMGAVTPVFFWQSPWASVVQTMKISSLAAAAGGRKDCGLTWWASWQVHGRASSSARLRFPSRWDKHINDSQEVFQGVSEGKPSGGIWVSSLQILGRPGARLMHGRAEGSPNYPCIVGQGNLCIHAEENWEGMMQNKGQRRRENGLSV